MDLAPSKLGTQEYWDGFYATEIKNYAENPSDTGERWFDDSGAEDRMVAFVEEELMLEPSHRVLDLGTGNGHLLFALREAGVQGDFLGIDYSLPSIEFARTIAGASREGGGSGSADSDDDGDGGDAGAAAAAAAPPAIRFEQADFIGNPGWTAEQFDLVLDKGTLDAIALSTIADAPRRYAASVVPLLRAGGRLMITSCNFTRAELAEVIGLRVAHELAYPSFEFGGQKGSSVVTLVFQKD